MTLKFVILEDRKMRVVELPDMSPDANVIAEVIDGDLVIPKNPFASVTDFMWPENMFMGKPIPLYEFMKQGIKLK